MSDLKRMSDERLKELETKNSWRLAEACREIRELRAELDALNKPRTLDVLREQSGLCRELKATIEGHEAALRNLCTAAKNCVGRDGEGRWAEFLSERDTKRIDALEGAVMKTLARLKEKP